MVEPVSEPVDPGTRCGIAWLTAYAIGLSTAGLAPDAIADRVRAAASPTAHAYRAAMTRVRLLPGLDSRLRWTALVALRLAARQERSSNVATDAR